MAHPPIEGNRGAQGAEILVKATVHKYRSAEDRDADRPYEVLEGDGNLLTYGGASALAERLKGTGVTAFDNTNAYLGVGDSSTAVAVTQTDLQASSNKHREAMDATYPTHTDGTTLSSHAVITYKSSYEAADANFAWAEWALFNASSSGRMFNRKVESFGTKANPDVWTLTITITFS